MIMINMNLVTILNVFVSNAFSGSFIGGDTTRTWSSAESYCQTTYGSHLASIHSAADNSAVAAICSSLPEDSQCWIGANDISNEGTFVWNDDTVNDYANYASGEPNNSGGNEDCVMISNGGTWNDGMCNDHNSGIGAPFICSFPTPDPTDSPTLSPTNKNCEDYGEIKHINWNQLHNGDNSEQIPYHWMNISFDFDTLTLALDIDLEYIGSSTEGNYDNEYNLGTTYVIDFQSFATHGSFINKPGECQNRLESSFDGINNITFNQCWAYSEYPYLSVDDLGSNTYLSYPPPSEYWSLSVDHNSCTPIHYQATFDWNDLSNCKDYDGNELIEIVDDYTKGVITLSGTIYVNIVSPYSMGTDTGYYRVYPLIQQDFLISIGNEINVLASTGVDLFTTSIIGIFENEVDHSFKLSVLTQSADYLELTNPQILSTPFGSDINPIITATTASCLVAASYQCAQIFTITMNETVINCPPETADFSGIYDILFTATCPGEEAICNAFLDDNGGSNVALSVESNFIDTTCDPQIYSVLYDGKVTFYDDDTFEIEHNKTDNYVIGKDNIYVQIVVDFPNDADGDDFNIFNVEIDNVFVCTSDNGTQLLLDLDQQNGNGGCLSSNIDIDGPYNIISNGVPDNTYDAEIISNDAMNVVRFSFLTFDVGRTMVYIHAQITLELKNGIRRRLLLSDDDSNTLSDQIRHFDGSVPLQNEVIVMYTTDIDENSTPHLYLMLISKWAVIMTLFVFL